MYFLREALGCAGLGVTVVEGDDGWDETEHDHGETDHEEVYVLVDGAARMTVDGDTVDFDAGGAVRVDPESTRSLSFTADDSRMVIAGAP